MVDPEEPLSGPPPSRGSGIIFGLIAIALILAISFFYITHERRREPADAVNDAAESVDSAANVIGDAAMNAVNRLRNHN